MTLAEKIKEIDHLIQMNIANFQTLSNELNANFKGEYCSNKGDNSEYKFISRTEMFQGIAKILGLTFVFESEKEGNVCLQMIKIYVLNLKIVFLQKIF